MQCEMSSEETLKGNFNNACVLFLHYYEWTRFLYGEYKTHIDTSNHKCI